MNKLAIYLALLLFSNPTFANSNLTLKTPRGTNVNVTLHIPSGTNFPLIVVAPGQSCNSKGPIFETLGQMGEAQHYAIIRFEWSYCNVDSGSPNPSENLVNEIEDFKTVLQYAKAIPSIDFSKIILAGKSLGSLVAYAVFKNEPSARSLALLTPVCTYTTDDNGNPLPEPLRVGEESYPKIKDDSRPILMAMGNQDTLCLLPALYDFLKDSKGNITTIIGGGGHSLTIKDASGKLDQEKTQKNIETLMASLINWANLN